MSLLADFGIPYRKTGTGILVGVVALVALDGDLCISFLPDVPLKSNFIGSNFIGGNGKDGTGGGTARLPGKVCQNMI
jgi:hypothetical protein